MEVVGLSLSAIALASLFKTCVECFEYYEATRDAKEDLITVLVQLDLEKTRLLIWGDQAGILKTAEQGRSRYLDQYEKELEGVFTSLKFLFTKSDESREVYGRILKRQQDNTIGLIRDDLSRSLKRLFVSAWDQFKTDFKPSTNGVLRIKWAITGQRQLEHLIVKVRGLIDSLNQFIAVPREIIDSIVYREITLVDDLSRLHLIKAASEGVYGDWEKRASVVIQQSEAGTLDLRGSEEVLQDSNDPPTVPRLAETNSVTYVTLPNHAKLVYALTEHCFKSATDTPCNQATFGADALQISSKFAHADWRRDWSIGDICFGQIHPDDPEQWQKWEMDSASLKRGGTVLIYCSPCVCQVHTALGLISSSWNGSPLIEIKIRVDDRIHSKCCEQGTASANIRNLRAALGTRDFPLARHFDRPWLDQRLDYLEDDDDSEEVEMPVSEQSAGNCLNPGDVWPPLLQVIVLGEYDPMTAMMRRPPFKLEPRMPKVNHIYLMGTSSSSKRRLLGSFDPTTVSATSNSVPSTGINSILGSGKENERGLDDDTE